MKRNVAVVLGTYNRPKCLQGCITSIRNNSGTSDYDIIVVDGGSTDGTREWLADEEITASRLGLRYEPIVLNEQPPLQGAVHAFNIGFTYAVQNEYPYIVHLNDDAELATPNMLVSAVSILESNPRVGEVAFAFDLRGGYGFDQWNGKVYANYGMIRREAGMEVARAQGDPTGCKFWHPIFKTYGGDSEFGCFLHRRGWFVHPAADLKVHDLNSQDSLRDRNNSGQTDSALFFRRWHDAILEPGDAGRGPNPITRLL